MAEPSPTVRLSAYAHVLAVPDLDRSVRYFRDALGDHSYFELVHVDDIDALHRELVGRGAFIGAPPADKPWGLREMPVATPDGHRLMLAQVKRPA